MCPYTGTTPFVWYYLNEQCCHNYSVKDHSVMYTLNFIIECTSVKNSLKFNRGNVMSWVAAMTYNEASHYPLDLSIVNRMTVHEPIYIFNGSKFFNSKNIWKVLRVCSSSYINEPSIITEQ